MARLIVVGSGIKSVAHLTDETMRVIKRADKVLFLVHDETLKEWIVREARSAESLDSIYFSTEKRVDAYQRLTDYILNQYAENESLCVVMYGHPCVFASSALEAVRKVQAENGQAVILPAVSAMDCLFSDLHIDPGDQGCFSVDATELLVYEKPIDSHSHLILWQVTSLGRHDTQKTQNIKVLQDYLLRFYPPAHPVCAYEAAVLPSQPPQLIWGELSTFNEMKLSLASTIYLPPEPYSKMSEKYLSLLGMDVGKFQLTNKTHTPSK